MVDVNVKKFKHIRYFSFCSKRKKLISYPLQNPKQRTKTYQFSSPNNGMVINLLTPNVNYSGRTAPLTSKVAFYIFIQQI